MPVLKNKVPELPADDPQKRERNQNALQLQMHQLKNIVLTLLHSIYDQEDE